MIFIKVFQKLSQFSGIVPLEHWVSRVAVNTCLNQIESEKVRPEVRHADLSIEEQAVVENLASSSAELAPDQRFASRQLVEHLLASVKPVERLAIDSPLGVQVEPGEVLRTVRREQVDPAALTPDDVKKIGQLLKVQAVFVGTVVEYEEGGEFVRSATLDSTKPGEWETLETEFTSHADPDPRMNPMVVPAAVEARKQ